MIRDDAVGDTQAQPGTALRQTRRVEGISDLLQVGVRDFATVVLDDDFGQRSAARRLRRRVGPRRTALSGILSLLSAVGLTTAGGPCCFHACPSRCSAVIFPVGMPL